MKTKKTLLITVIAFLLTLSVGVFSVFAEETVYEGSDLPVSESYVLRVIGALEERIYHKVDTMIDALNARIDSLGTAEPAADLLRDTTHVGGNGGYVRIPLTFCREAVTDTASAVMRDRK